MVALWKYVLVVATAGELSGARANDGVVFVNASAPATSSETGESWEDAYRELGPALRRAVAGDEVWVAAGVYRADATGTEPLASFHMANGVALYGGFLGHETARDLRNPALNRTVLTGERGEPTDEDDSEHVVVCDGADRSAILDGFTVTRGRALGRLLPGSHGGGLLVLRGDPTIRRCVFEENGANYGAGASMAGSPVFDSCVFRRNFVPSNGVGGGGIHVFGAGRPKLVNCEFVGNTAGGGFGGAVFSNTGGGAVLINCTLLMNSGGIGGAIVTAHGSTVLSNSIVWGNTGAPTFFGSITARYSNLQGGARGVGGISADPRFAGGPADLRLLDGSPCIDSGDNGLLPPDVWTDIGGQPRFVDDGCTTDTGPTGAPVVDMGAREFHGTLTVVCACDWNGCDGLDSQDLMDFVGAFFSGGGDFNGEDGTDSQDLYDYLDCFFAGCTPG